MLSLRFAMHKYNYYFAQEAGEAYTSQADAFTQLFQDDEFYKVVMEQLARAMYRKFKK